MMDAIQRLLEEDIEAAGMVVGDETRLRQIVTNLARWVLSLPLERHKSNVLLSVMLASSRRLVGASASRHD